MKNQKLYICLEQNCPIKPKVVLITDGENIMKHRRCDQFVDLQLIQLEIRNPSHAIQPLIQGDYLREFEKQINERCKDIREGVEEFINQVQQKKKKVTDEMNSLIGLYNSIIAQDIIEINEKQNLMDQLREAQLTPISTHMIKIFDSIEIDSQKSRFYVPFNQFSQAQTLDQTFEADDECKFTMEIPIEIEDISYLRFNLEKLVDDGQWNAQVGIIQPQQLKIQCTNFTYEEIRIFECNQNTVKSVCITKDRRILASGARDGLIRLWNAQTNAIIGELRGHLSDNDIFLCFTSDGSKLISSSADKTIRIWDTKKQEQIGSTLTIHTDWVFGICIAPDDQNFISASSDKSIIQWDLENQSEVGKFLNGHTQQVYGVNYSHDGRMVATCSADKTVIVWDAKTRKKDGMPLIGHQALVWRVLFFKNSQTLISCSYDKTIRIWDVSSQTCTGTLIGHSDIIRDICLLAQDTIIASAGLDKTIRFWDVSGMAQIGDPLQQQEKMWTLARSMDENSFYSSGFETKIRQWKIKSKNSDGTFLINAQGQLEVPYSLTHNGNVDFKMNEGDEIELNYQHRDTIMKVQNLTTGKKFQMKLNCQNERKQFVIKGNNLRILLKKIQIDKLSKLNQF